jgi:hypothetical protein
MTELGSREEQGLPSLLLETFFCSADRFVLENSEEHGTRWSSSCLLDDRTRSEQEGRYHRMLKGDNDARTRHSEISLSGW